MLERYHPTTCTVSDLIVGNSYSFRVFSENLCGLSTSAAVTKELAHIQKAGGSGLTLCPHLHSQLFLGVPAALPEGFSGTPLPGQYHPVQTRVCRVRTHAHTQLCTRTRTPLQRHG